MSHIKIDPSLPEAVQVLIKASYHLCKKAEPVYGNTMDPVLVGYRVPRRELDRVRNKVSILAGEGVSNG